MKIVNRETFLDLPEETVFQKYEQNFFEHLAIKGETLRNDNGKAIDFFYQDLHDALPLVSGALDAEDLLQIGESVSLDFDCGGRDGCFDNEQLFAVWEKGDVQGLIRRLQKAIDAAYKE